MSAGVVVYRWRPAGPESPEASDERPGSDERPALPASGDPASRHQGDLRVEVLCAHMGGPLWARKDEHAWSFPKGELDDGEEPFAAARREFAEELGIPAPAGDYRRLGEYRYSSGKVVVFFAVEADAPLDAIRPGTFEMEWPPRSGRRQAFPEVDRAAWFDVPSARTKLVVGQVPALDDLRRLLDEAS